MQKFTTNCNFGGRKLPVTLYIGNPSAGSHPLAFQNKWLNKTKGGEVPSDIMESFLKLKEVSDKDRISFEDLCKYVIDELHASSSLESDFNKATEFSSESGDNNSDTNTDSDKK